MSINKKIIQQKKRQVKNSVWEEIEGDLLLEAGENPYSIRREIVEKRKKDLEAVEQVLKKELVTEVRPQPISKRDRALFDFVVQNGLVCFKCKRMHPEGEWAKTGISNYHGPWAIGRKCVGPGKKR